MPVNFDHTIVPCTDKQRSATFFAELFGLPRPREEGPFLALDLANDVSFYFAGWDTEVHQQHYCFLMSEEEFDAFYARLGEREHWADPNCTMPNAVNDDDGGRGTYFRDPDGHLVEVITVRYGGRPLSLP